jgi:hypothetical protein
MLKTHALHAEWRHSVAQESRSNTTARRVCDCEHICMLLLACLCEHGLDLLDCPSCASCGFCTFQTYVYTASFVYRHACRLQCMHEPHHNSSNNKLNHTFVAHRASIALIATEPFHICISSAMPLRGVDGYVYAYIVLAVSASDVQVFLFLGDFSLDDIARHFAKLVHNGRPTVLPGAGDRCMYWYGSESYVHCVCFFLVLLLYKGGASK